MEQCPKVFISKEESPLVFKEVLQRNALAALTFSLFLAFDLALTGLFGLERDYCKRDFSYEE